MAIVLLLVTSFTAANIWYWGPGVTGQGIAKVQPVQFTHEHHVGGLGIDCRFCHFNVERAGLAQVPPTRVCMNCHSQMYTDAQILEPVRESWRSDMPIPWVKVHNLSDFVYFNHSAHVNKGIGCAECHGRVDHMPLMYQASSLHMAWCLQCHMDPEQFVRPKNKITDMAYKHPSNAQAKDIELAGASDKKVSQHELAKEYNVQSKTSCSTCHR
ncbi:MAG: cytochrome c3 family protein [Candidatus Sumerlaeaceae bacterium]